MNFHAFVFACKNKHERRVRESRDFMRTNRDACGAFKSSYLINQQCLHQTLRTLLRFLFKTRIKHLKILSRISLKFVEFYGIIVASETVARANILLERYIMPKFMKMLNNISRSQAIYRHNRISVGDLQTGHYAFALVICRAPGRSQEELAQELCINKSTVARNLNCLEEKGYIVRNPLPNDKRQFAVYPTEKMLGVLPDIKKASHEWTTLLSEGISQEEMQIFDSVLERMQTRAREIIEKQEGNK